MFIPNAVSLILLLLLPLCTTTSVAPRNALALIEAQPDLTLIAALIKRDPELVKLYSTAKDVTIVAAPDSTFTTTDPNNVIYADRAGVRAILQDIVIKGLVPTSRITKKPIYFSTELTDPRFVDTSRGSAVAKFVEIAGKKTVDVGAGVRANITQGNLRFNGGILHKLSNPLDNPASFFSIAARLNILSISQLSGGLEAVFELITSARDTTLFSVGFGPSGLPPNVTVDEFVNILSNYVIAPGVYLEKDFTGQRVKALNGAPLTLSGFGTGKAKVNDAVVIRSDIFATNGVLHVLDRYVVSA
ncbi:hypothetical protein G7Y79_00020g049260 [Physcia stellaris]|nr:hypothetical protein G7Y79_00020g049260 [Physcia stellaris]